MNISPLCINDINRDVEISEEKQTIIKKVFRMKSVNIMSLYRNLVQGLVSSKNVKIDGVRTQVYDIDSTVVRHHLELLQLRNKHLDNIDSTTLKYYDYKIPKPKKLF